MIKLFVTDLDHTLLNEEKQINEKDQRAIDRLIISGIELAIATGRSDPEFRYIMDELGHPCHRISQNGVYVRTAQEEKLYSASFAPEIARNIFRDAAKFPFQTFINVDEQSYTPHMTEEMRQYIARMRQPIFEDTDILQKLNNEYRPCKLGFIGDKELLLQMMKEIDCDEYHQHVDIFLSTPHSIDVIPTGISKGVAIERLIERLGFDLSEVACIGDSYNDIPMLELVTHSFAMEHADHEVKQTANHVVSSVSEAIDYVLKLSTRV